MEEVTTSFRISKIALDKLKEQATALGMSMSDYINSIVLSALGSPKKAMKEEGLEAALAFFNFLYRQLYKTSLQVDSTVSLIVALKGRMQGDRRIGNISVVGENVEFETKAGIVSIPIKPLPDFAAVRKELISIHRNWLSVIKKSEEVEEKKKISSFMEIL